MLKRENRLPGTYLKSEKTISSLIYTLKIAKNGKELSRFGFIVSKKIDKRATVRNEIRRKFRGSIEERLNEISKGYDFLFILKNDIRKTDYRKVLFEQLKREKFLT